MNQETIALLDKVITEILSQDPRTIHGPYKSLNLLELIKATKPLLTWQGSSPEEKKTHFYQALEDLDAFVQGMHGIGFTEWVSMHQFHKEYLMLATQRPGFDVNELLSAGQTLLGSAAESGNTEIVQYLLDFEGIDINKGGQNGPPVLLAAKGKKASTAILLLSDKRIVIPKNLLSTAVEYQVNEVVIYLLSQTETQVDVASIVNSLGKASYEYPYLIADEKLTLFNLLFNHESMALLQEKDLQPCIEKAMRRENSFALKILLTHRASNPNFPLIGDNRKEHPLLWCTGGNNSLKEEMFMTLLACPKTDLTDRRERKTPYNRLPREMSILEYIEAYLEEVSVQSAWDYNRHTVNNFRKIKPYLIEAHLQRFYKETMLADPDKLDLIIKNHEEAKLTPNDLRDFMMKQILEPLKKQDKADEKFTLLLNEKLKIFGEISDPSPKNALMRFIWPEKKLLIEQIDAELTKINSQRGVSAPPTTATFKVASKTSINEDNDNPAPENKEGKKNPLSNLFKKK
jgi:hypothetical protein